jgi:hypothetical protein
VLRYYEAWLARHGWRLGFRAGSSIAQFTRGDALVVVNATVLRRRTPTIEPMYMLVADYHGANG